MNIAQIGKNFYIETTSNINSLVFNKVITNSTFNYAYHVATLMKYLKVEIKPTIDEYERSIEKILGKTISSITKGINSFDYSDIYIPYDTDSITKIYDNDLSVKTVMKSMKGRAIRNYQVYIRKVKGEEYDINPLIKKEKIYRYYANIIGAICQMILKATKKYKKRIYTNDPHITSIYNEKGIAHNWDILIYNDGTEVKKSEAHLNKQKIIVNYKSSLTGILRTETNKLNWHEADVAYYKKIAKKTFFQFYRVKCPENGLHTFKDNICTKCGYVDNKIDNSYYEKYKNIYINETKRLENAWHKDDNENDNYKKKKNVKSNWKYNKSSIIEISKLATIPINVIEYIGAMEGRTTLEIYNGEKRPPLPQYKNSLQLILLMDHYYNTCCIYNQLRSGIIIDYDPLIKFMKSNGIETSELSNFKNYLPKNLYEKYNKIIDEVRNDDSMTSEDIYKLYLQYLCSIIDDISKINNKMRKIAIYLIDNIIKQELSTCISNGKFDRSLFKSKNIGKDGAISLDAIAENTNYDVEFEESVDKDDMFDYNDIDFNLDAN